MKTKKYMLNSGLAFSEIKDLRKLEKQAEDGWLLNRFAWGGFFYELTPGPKQELTYALDCQSTPDADYFEIYDTAGWTYVTSAGNQFHIFSAPKGTAPIYSDNEIDEGKYLETTSMLGKFTLYTFIALVISTFITALSKTHFSILYYPLFGIKLICLTAFIFCFMPYVAYKYKEIKHK